MQTEEAGKLKLAQSTSVHTHPPTYKHTDTHTGPEQQLSEVERQSGGGKRPVPSKILNGVSL